MEEVLIKNGNVLLFENNDVVIKKINVFIKNGKIEKIFLDDEKSKIYEEYNISVSEGKDNNLKNLHIIDATNKIVMPGLINVHAHIPMSIFRETTEGYKLYEWLEDKIWPVEDKLTEEDTERLSQIEENFHKAINDDLNMPLAMSFVWEAARFEKKNPEVAKLLAKFDTVLGIKIDEVNSEKQEIPQEILDLVEQRKMARENKDWTKSDELRDLINQKGYLIKDTKNGVEISKK